MKVFVANFRIICQKNWIFQSERRGGSRSEGMKEIFHSTLSTRMGAALIAKKGSVIIKPQTTFSNNLIHKLVSIKKFYEKILAIFWEKRKIETSRRGEEMEKGKNKYGCRNASEKSCERKMCASGGEKEGKGKLCVALSRFPCGFAKVLRLLLCVCAWEFIRWIICFSYEKKKKIFFCLRWNA